MSKRRFFSGKEFPKDDFTFTQDTKNEIPQKAGIYRIYDNKGFLMYAGQAHDLNVRLKYHFRTKRKGIFIEDVRGFYIHNENQFITDTLLEYYETEVIKLMNPKYNKHKKAPTRYLND